MRKNKFKKYLSIICIGVFILLSTGLTGYAASMFPVQKTCLMMSAGDCPCCAGKNMVSDLGRVSTAECSGCNCVKKSQIPDVPDKWGIVSQNNINFEKISAYFSSIPHLILYQPDIVSRVIEYPYFKPKNNLEILRTIVLLI